MKFTDAQNDVINARGTNLLVSAAAGSGKTTVLVERVLSLIRDGANIDEMLIVTFTRAASADMRRKLTERLYKWANDGEDAALTQLEKLECAKISTLDSFCINIVRENFELADCDPAFRILDSAESTRLLEEALDDVLEDAYSRGIGRLGENRSPDEVREMVRQLWYFVSKRPDLEKWFENALALVDDGGNGWQNELLSDAVSAIERAAEACREATDLLELDGAPAEYRSCIESEARFIENLKGLDNSDLNARLSAFAFGRIPAKKKTSDPEIAEKIQQLRKTYKDIINDLKERTGFVFDPASMEDIRADREILVTLYDIASDVEKHLCEAKKELGGLTFTDVEKRALMVLNDEAAADVLRRRYKYIFIDEYQDTSDMQEALINRISSGTNLFMVGDVKQSIYRFRDAEPSLFMLKYKIYMQGGSNRLIILKENFRSNDSVIDAVNLIFKRAMIGGESEIKYGADEMLYRGSAENASDFPAEVIVISKTGAADAQPAEAQDTENAEEAGDELENAQLEGAAIAHRIKKLLEADPALKYRDICVLSRVKTNSVLSKMADVLAGEGIPCYADVSDNLFNVFEINIVMAVLRLLVSRRDEIDILTVLRSPLVNMTTEQIIEIRAENPDVPLWQALENVRELYTESACFLELMDEMRICAQGLSLNRLIRRLITRTGFYTFLGALPGGMRRQSNLDLLCSIAYKYEHDSGGTLADFCEYAENLKNKSDNNEAHELGEGDDVVRLMTAHKSKGLEFKVVFAVGLGRALHARERHIDIIADRDLGLGIPHADTELGTIRDTLATQAIKHKVRAQSYAEELRILYVMLTRAKSKLIMVGTVSDADKQAEKWQQGVYTSSIDLIMATALEAPDKFNVTILNAGSLSLSEAEMELNVEELMQSTPIAEQLDTELLSALNWKYPDAVRPYAPVKLAVTRFGKEFTGGSELPDVKRAPDFLSESARYNPTGRGTAIHMALMNLDLDSLKDISDFGSMCSAIKIQLKEMANDLRLLPDEYAHVSAYALAAFLMGEVGTRLRRSDVVKREWSFSLKVPTERAIPGYPAGSEIYVQGSIDLCFIEDGQWVLIDYKTSRTDDEEALIERYRVQLSLYAEALRRITGLPVKDALICLISQEKVIRIAVDK